jgi:branched-chain amino acid transport system permease protein
VPIDTVINILIGGLLTGLIYGLSSLGLSVIFGVVKIVNFAHGEMMVGAMFLTLLLVRWVGLDPLVWLPVVAIVLFGCGYVLQRFLIERVAHLADHMQFLLMAAIATTLVAAYLMIFGPDDQAIDISYSYDSYAIGPLIIDKARVFAAVAAVGVTALLFLFFRYTLIGKAIRACGDNHMGALVVGLNVRRLYALTFGIGTACLGAAGAIMLVLIDVQPYLGPQYTLLAFVIVIIGGLGSLPGAMLGGILIGFSEALAGIVIQPSLKSAFSFALLIIILLLRPQGLLGRRT